MHRPRAVGALMLTAALISVLFLGAAPPMQVTPYEMGNTSMAPAIANGEPVFVDSRHRWIRGIRRFDIVVVRSPDDPQDVHVKRVIGLGGEKLELKHGAVYINGRKLAEPFVTAPAREDFGPITIPEGHYFFLSDNRTDADDSRSWRTPTAGDELIVGKVMRF